MRLACVVLLGLVACNSEPLGAGGNGGVESVDLGPVICDGKTEVDCNNQPSCVADHCSFCGCGQAFVGCRLTRDPPRPCPRPSCPAGICCSGLSQTQCSANSACTAVSCPDCDGNLTLYQGCFGPSQGAPACPALICQARCTVDKECSPGELCRAPNTTWAKSCVSDGDCGGGWCIHNGCYAVRGTCQPLGD